MESLAIGVVGTGRVGSVVGAALRAAGHRVVAVTAGSAASRSRAAAMLPGVPIASLSAVAQAATDLLLIAVPDDALAPVARGLDTGARYVAHTSGAYGPAVLGVPHGLALHPAMTFTGEAADLARLPGIAWGVTAEDRVFAARLVADLGGVPEWIAEEARPLYHAGLAHGANHLVTLVNDAAGVLRAAGVSDPSRVLRPLLTAALDNALRMEDAALTGPVSRGDAGTVGRHVAELPGEYLPAYVAMARRTAERAVAAGRLSREAAEPLLKLLTES